MIKVLILEKEHIKEENIDIFENLYKKCKFKKVEDFIEIKKWNYNDGRIDYKFSDEISKPIVTELNSLVKFFTQIISLKNFLENKNIPNIFFNCFFPFGDNTIEYYDNIVDDLEKNKISKLRTFDNIDTYYSLHALWDCVPSDYKELNHLEFIGEENLDESLHPTPRGHELWSDKLFDYGKYD